MLPLHRVALGLVLVALDLRIDGYDLLANPLGWLLVLSGLVPLRHRLGSGVAVAAGLALAVSVLAYPPGLVGPDLSPALAWGLSLPQAVTVVMLAFALAAVVPDRDVELRLAGWLLVAAAVLPTIVIGGGMMGLVGFAAFAAVASLLYLVYLLMVSAPQVDEGERRTTPGARI